MSSMEGVYYGWPYRVLGPLNADETIERRAAFLSGWTRRAGKHTAEEIVVAALCSGPWVALRV